MANFKEYNINETLNNCVDSDKLTIAISESDISVNLSYINSDIETFFIYFEYDLNDSDINILDNIVYNHDGNTYKFKLEALPYINSFNPNQDYDILGLHNKPYVNDSGLLTSSEYYKNYNPAENVFSDLVIKENISYEFNNETGLPKKKTIEINFYLENEEIGYTKTVITYFQKEEIEKENNLLSDGFKIILKGIVNK